MNSAFINHLIQLTDSIENDVKYQFIISTHSPFMLSDVPKENIICIDIKDHQRILVPAKKSFASNYYDIISDAFFLEDSVGKFAKKKINNLIKMINSLDKQTPKYPLEYTWQYKYIYDQIMIIDDEYLRNILFDQLKNKLIQLNEIEALLLEKEKLQNRLQVIEQKLGDINDQTR